MYFHINYVQRPELVSKQARGLSEPKVVTHALVMSHTTTVEHSLALVVREGLIAHGDDPVNLPAGLPMRCDGWTFDGTKKIWFRLSGTLVSTSMASFETHRFTSWERQKLRLRLGCNRLRLL